MSFVKSLLTILLSSLFILSLYLTINSYTLGSVLQKENAKSFIQSQLEGNVLGANCQEICESQMEGQSCDDTCSLVEPQMRQACMDVCTSNTDEDVMQLCVSNCMAKVGSSKDAVSDVVDDLYSQEVIGGVSLESLSNFFTNSILLLIVSAMLGLSVFLVAEKPLTKTGNNLIVVAISLLALALIPSFVVNTENSVITTAFDFLSTALQQQLIIGIILIAAGAALMIAGKKLKK